MKISPLHLRFICVDLRIKFFSALFNAVADRVRRMVKNGTIRSVRAVVDPAALGKTIEAQIDVKLRPTTSADAFEKLGR